MIKAAFFLSVAIPASAALTLSSHTYSQDAGIAFLEPEAVMGITKNIYLNVIDEVDGGCWTNSGVIEQEARNILTNNGVNVSLEPLTSNRLMTAEIRIGAVGYRTEGLCVGFANLTLMRPFIHESYSNAGNGYSHIYMGSSIDKERGFVISGSLLNQNIRDVAQEFIYEISSDVADGRKTEEAKLYIEHFSEYYNADPVTQAERDRELRREFEPR